MHKRRFIVDLSIPEPEMLRYYRGHGQCVVARTRDGRSLRFPASWLRAHVGVNGVQGTFFLEVDPQYRLLSMGRLPVS